MAIKPFNAVDLHWNAASGRVGHPDQLADATLAEFVDGPQRHVRFVQLRDAAGFEARVLVDRGFDLGEVRVQGIPLGWRSPTGFRAPSLTNLVEEDGSGLLRSFDGFLVTCGLDHVRGPATGPAAHFGTRREKVFYPLHGRIASQPARLQGYGVLRGGEGVTLWCEGEARQSMLYGENLSLSRRIEMPAGSGNMVLTDVVRNEGHTPTPHMLMYHFNLGYPLLDTGTQLLLPTGAASAIAGAQAALAGERLPDEVEDHAARVGSELPLQCAVVNRLLGTGIAVGLHFSAAELPRLQIWRNRSPGFNVLALEPATNGLGTRSDHERDARVQMLQPGEERRYTLKVALRYGDAAIADVERTMGAGA